MPNHACSYPNVFSVGLHMAKLMTPLLASGGICVDVEHTNSHMRIHIFKKIFFFTLDCTSHNSLWHSLMSENQLFHSQISLSYNQFPQNSNYLGSFSNAVLYLKGIIANGHTYHIMPSICLLWQYSPIASHISNPMFVCQSFRNQWVLGMFLSGTVLDQHSAPPVQSYRQKARSLECLSPQSPTE